METEANSLFLFLAHKILRLILHGLPQIPYGIQVHFLHAPRGDKLKNTLGFAFPPFFFYPHCLILFTRINYLHMSLLSGYDVWIVVVKLGDHLAQTLCKLRFLLASDRNLT